MDLGETRARIAVVGGGIAGLAAAYFLAERGLAVTVLESSSRVGGKLVTSEVAGIPVDAGAEALLARRPEGVDLIRAVGLGEELVVPGELGARIWTRGAFRQLPRRQYMGVPGDFAELERSGILSAEGLARARKDADLPATHRAGDVPAGEFVGARFGQEVVDRLVEPLLGGVYAGRTEQLSFDATLAGLAQASRQHASLAEAVRAVLGRPPPAPPAPRAPSASSAPSGSARAGTGGAGAPAQPAVFTTLAAGLGTLPQALADASGAVVRTRATVREIARTAGGWRLTVGPTIAPELVEADAVVLALPARPASRLLAPVEGASAASDALAEIEYASMAIVTLAYPASAFPEPLTGSGYLVPAVDGRAVKAVTFSTMKWPHLASAPAPAAGRGRDPIQVVRCSIGRIGEEAILQRDDQELVAVAAQDLAAATGVSGPYTDARVTRWGGGLPQYTVGHLGRVDRIRAGIAGLPGLAICGAAFDGVGIPACIATASVAADQIVAYLESRPLAAGSGSGSA